MCKNVKLFVDGKGATSGTANLYPQPSGIPWGHSGGLRNDHCNTRNLRDRVPICASGLTHCNADLRCENRFCGPIFAGMNHHANRQPAPVQREELILFGGVKRVKCPRQTQKVQGGAVQLNLLNWFTRKG